MPVLNATTRIRTRESVLVPSALIGVFQRQCFRRAIGLPPMKAARPTKYVAWQEIEFYVNKTDPKTAKHIQNILKRKNDPFNNRIPIRDGILREKNVWDILKRQELRVFLGLPISEERYAEHVLGKILDFSLDTRGVDTYEAWVANYFVCWYGILEKPDDFPALLENHLLSVPREFLEECYARLFVPETASLHTTNPGANTFFDQVINLRPNVRGAASTAKVLQRTELRTSLGIPPLNFNFHPGGYIGWSRIPDYWDHPLTLGEIIEAIDPLFFPFTPGTYPAAILQQSVWIRERANWALLTKRNRADTALNILKRASLRSLLGLQPLAAHSNSTTLEMIVAALPPTNKIRQTIESLDSVGFYDDPKAGLQSILRQIDKGHPRYHAKVSTYIAAYLIAAHFSQKDYSFKAAAKDFEEIMEAILPDKLPQHGKIAAITSHHVFHAGNQKFKYLWPIDHGGEEKPEVLFVSAIGLLLQPNKLAAFFFGVMGEFLNIRTQDIGQCLRIYFNEPNLNDRQLIDFLVLVFSNFNALDPDIQSLTTRILDGYFGQDDKGYNKLAAELNKLPLWSFRQISYRKTKKKA